VSTTTLAVPDKLEATVDQRGLVPAGTTAGRTSS
jgi:hypothetical protein